MTQLLPTVAVVSVWLALYLLQGYGTRGSSEYINPLQNPLQYLSAFPLRLSNAFSVLLLGMPADIWFLAAAARPMMAAWGVLSLIVVGSWLWKVAQKSSDEEKRHLSWLTLCMVLSLLPQLAGLLGPRSFLIPSIASTVVVSVLVVKSFEGERAFAKLGAVFLRFVHGVVGVFVWLGASALYEKIGRDVDHNQQVMGLDESSATERSYLLISTPEVMSLVR